MARQTLGRGLSALIGDDNGPRDSVAANLEIDIDLIEPNPQQPRTRFPDLDLDELAQSIRANGVVQPIVVRRQGSRFQIVAGERRWRASQRAGLHKIPAVVKEVSDEKLLEIALVENIQRQQLNAMEEAKAYRQLIDTLGLTQELVSAQVGKARVVVANSIRLLNLPDDIQHLVEDGRLSAGHGRALLQVNDRETLRTLANLIVANGLSVREAEKAAKRAGKGDGAKKNASQPRPADANVKAAETKLMRHMNTNVKIIENKKGVGGKIEIEYYGIDDLDRLYNLILK